MASAIARGFGSGKAPEAFVFKPYNKRKTASKTKLMLVSKPSLHQPLEHSFEGTV